MDNTELKIDRNISLAEFSTMKIGGTANFFTTINSEKELRQAHDFALKNNIELFPIGSGSNTIFSDEKHNRLFTLIKIKGIIKTYDGAEFTNIEVSAGKNWDEFVKWTIENDLAGLECLSGIPGTVGAGPIQNIGAYGSEIKDHLTFVKIYDLSDQKIYQISQDKCEFTYRDSIFKKNLGKFIIISVGFQLSKNNQKLNIPEYKDVQMYFLEKGQKTASAKKIRKAILEIRSRKIPWPSEIPNAGSFFKNSIVENNVATKILLQYPEMPYFKIDENSSKLYAGWLIEKCELKGFNFGKIKIHENNALVLTNPNGLGNFSDLEKAVNQIKAAIFEKFEIELEIEPNIIK
jgi:UDP-N-acetylmuramate dehydrogenase